MSGYPNVHDYTVLNEYIELQLHLLEVKDEEEVKRICFDMLKLIPMALMQSSEFGSRWKKARRESLENSGEYHDESYYDMYVPIRLNATPYKKLAIIYEKEGNYSQAIQLCEEALSFGFTDDGTKGGMEGRLAKLKKKAGL